ncbi:rubredoxin-NAD(+) reductase AlkT [Massilia terrae]|uniref:FAD-dependent oxidoreductase n=1 Tax=Massilia terrae TaxID=1811224 RepID=A0ABT2D2E3_9BURK|nr:FAD-dependent oxidoreductase [Massilia terrae]MCS0660399.1 FAD-dependent oxidoreductase [Massilia terrae]
MRDPVIIIGAGMAAYSLAREFRKLDQATPLMLVAGGAAHAYAKPALSNALALGKEPHALVQAGPEQMADTLDMTVLANTWVTAIDHEAREIDTAQGRFTYSQLVLALGADPVRLPLAGDGAADVMSVNDLHDYTLLRERLAAAGAAARVAIIGAGLIGCEFADDLAGAGYRVTLVDPGSLPLSALAAPVLGEALVQAWSARPVTLRLGTTVDSVARDGDAYELTLADGTLVQADLVVSAVGLRPSVSLAMQAGLEVARGIRIDDFGKTSADDIYALGDCAEYSVGDGSAVMPFVAPMLVAARAIAATLAGTPTPIVLKQEAVIVKTPSCKLALLPPPRGVAGSWLAQAEGERIIARFHDKDGVLRGFGLTQHTPALRNQLLAELGRAA